MGYGAVAERTAKRFRGSVLLISGALGKRVGAPLSLGSPTSVCFQPAVGAYGGRHGSRTPTKGLAKR